LFSVIGTRRQPSLWRLLLVLGDKGEFGRGTRDEPISASGPHPSPNSPPFRQGGGKPALAPRFQKALALAYLYLFRPSTSHHPHSVYSPSLLPASTPFHSPQMAFSRHSSTLRVRVIAVARPIEPVSAIYHDSHGWIIQSEGLGRGLNGAPRGLGLLELAVQWASVIFHTSGTPAEW
jgi:hypothetical protein